MCHVQSAYNGLLCRQRYVAVNQILILIRKGDISYLLLMCLMQLTEDPEMIGKLMPFTEF